jgi:hypothetical protein
MSRCDERLKARVEETCLTYKAEDKDEVNTQHAYFFFPVKIRPRASLLKEMAHAIGAHPVHWHVDPEIRQHVSIYNVHRRKNQAGWGVKDSLEGEGFKVVSCAVHARTYAHTQHTV